MKEEEVRGERNEGGRKRREKERGVSVIGVA